MKPVMTNAHVGIDLPGSHRLELSLHRRPEPMPMCQTGPMPDRGCDAPMGLGAVEAAQAPRPAGPGPGMQLLEWAITYGPAVIALLAALGLKLSPAELAKIKAVLDMTKADPRPF